MAIHDLAICPECLKPLQVGEPRMMRRHGRVAVHFRCAIQQQKTRHVDPANYREYAIQQLRIAIDKDGDAPASAAMHQEQAEFALREARIPEQGEVLRYLEAEANRSINLYMNDPAVGKAIAVQLIEIEVPRRGDAVVFDLPLPGGTDDGGEP